MGGAGVGTAGEQEITSGLGRGPGERRTKLLPGPKLVGEGMRTSEQGLLAKLGFRDADREDPRHDKACRFFTRPDIAEKLLNAVHPPGVAWVRMWRHYTSPDPELAGLWTTWACVRGVTEDAVRTKSGFHIGFVDAVVHGRCSLHAPDIADDSDDDYRKRRSDVIRRFGERRDGVLEVDEVVVKIEVKIGRVPTSEVIRQIETYRGGNHSDLWVLAIDYALSEEERRALIAQRITPIRLGPAFEAYLRETDGAADVVSL